MKKYGLLVFLAIITIFFAKEFLLSQNDSIQIVAERDYLLMKSTSGTIWGYGNTQSANAINLAQTLSSYFTETNILYMFSLDEDMESQDDQITIKKLSKNIVHIELGELSLLSINGDLDEDEREKIINSNVSLQTDFHILNKNIVLDFLPQPKKGILYVSLNNPSTKTQKIFREKKLPLISTKETGGFMIKLMRNNLSLSVRH